MVAAVSGGSDSVALLELLRELSDAGAVVVAGVAHLNHRLRPDAELDVAFCRDLAGRAGLPFETDAIDVASAAREQRCSVEVAGRRIRYAFLERARVRLEAGRVAVAHTRDDQAETVLLRLLRGTGTRGLRGILAARGTVVRPLLDTGRDDLREYLRGRGQQWHEDATNSDLGHPRNRIRHELLPLLRSKYRPSVAVLLARAADIALEDDAYLERLAVGVASQVMTVAGGQVRLDVSGFTALPLALQRRAARLALDAAGCTRRPRLADIQRVLAACENPRQAPCRIAGVAMERFSEKAVLLISGPAIEGGRLPARKLAAAGAVDLPECGSGCRLRVEGPIKDEYPSAVGPFRVVLAASALQWPLVVRGWLPGDRMRPKGLGGAKKLQDLFVDRKLPRPERDRTPVVADGTGRIVWVVGHAVADGVEAAAIAGDVVILSFERPAGAGPEAL